MKLYAYTAILAKTMLIQGKITYTDKRGPRDSSVTGWIPLDSLCVRGHVLAEDAEGAKTSAINELKRQYPEERGYKDHDNVTVEVMREEAVG